MMNFLFKSKNSRINEILFLCSIFLILVKYIIFIIFFNMIFGRLSLDRNFLILENGFFDLFIF